MAGMRSVLLILISFCWTSASAMPVTALSGVSQVGIGQPEVDFHTQLHFLWSTGVLEDQTVDRDEDSDLTTGPEVTTLWRNNIGSASLSKNYNFIRYLDRIILFRKLIC